MRARLGRGGALVLLLLLAGCMPPGPRALLQGQRLIEQGNYARAAEKLRTATSLIATNAEAWNYLGIACQHLGRRDEAVKAYQRALALNHELSEPHYNLGCLWLEENKLDAARTEFTTFTLRRGNSAEGFLKLAATQARAHDLAAAEKSFNDALRLSPRNVEALNGLGLIRLQERRPADAEPYFAAALKAEPGYQPALLNSAIVAQEYLRDLPTALARYRQYLALKPPPPNAEAVAAIVRELEWQLVPPQRPAVVAKPSPPAVANPTSSKPGTGAVAHSLASPKAEGVSNPPRAASQPNAPANAPPASSQTVQLVRVSPEPLIKPAQDLTSTPTPTQRPAAEPDVASSARTSTATIPAAPQRGFFERVNPVNVFRGESKTGARVTPLPAPKEATGPAAQEPIAALAPAAPAGPLSRYNYRSPAAPAPGNRAEAQRFFEQGLQAQRARRLSDAIQAYREAIQQDPSFFEAQFYLAFAADQAGELATALNHYEYALAISPNDANARYNFALVLKQANCVTDAANELERLLAEHPNEARAHLALANLYAQQLHEPSEARPHYVKALELEPHSPQATDIRNWLRDHPR